ncbi:hypothetical protein H5410_000783 [Solanum commersonii]|uniref:Uncharacterized protein n=1 Tax=Solanum commersonii TaxID=4109 RepID=A0A9J6AXR0_SOLCO|nr:hypothetical protein H5410_000783 [Solanum commersonii]
MDFPANEPMFHDPTLNLWELVTHLPLLSLVLGLNRRHDSIPPSDIKSTRKILNLISGWSPGTNSSTAVSLLGWSPEKIEGFAREAETYEDRTKQKRRSLKPLPSPELVARRLLVRAAGAADCYCRP